MRLKKEKKILVCKLFLILSVFGFWLFVFIDFEVMFNNKKVTLWVHAPSIVEKGEEFEITIEAWDKFERLAGGYSKEITFDLESYNYSTLEEINSDYSLPKDYKFTSNYIWGGIYPAYKVKGSDNGLKTFKAEINTPGIHYIVVEEKDSGEKYRSNPIIVKTKVSKYLYWGDIHGHTLLSDGSGFPSEAYEFAKNVALLDFAALTDHSEHFPRMGDADVFNIFKNYIQTTNSFNDAGEFATFLALEWTPYYIVQGKNVMHGHLNVYFKGNDMPFFSTFSHYNQSSLFNYIEKNCEDDFIAWTHHSVKKQFKSDFAFYDEKINRLIEIYSVHGSSETIGDDNLFHPNDEIDKPGYSVRDALRMGRKFGIMASGDNHDGRLGHSISHTRASRYNQYPYTLSGYRLGHPFPNGLTGIFASELSRECLFEALYNRSCYATTWINRPYIEFKINGLAVGVNDSTKYVPALNTTRQIEILVCADGVSMDPNTITKIEKIEIFKNSELLTSWDDINHIFFRATYFDKNDITGTEYDDYIKKNGKYYIHEDSIKPIDPDDLNTNGFDYYYLRTIDSNGGVAWIGPIWVGLKS
ncbi:MAG: DUF3604 domain-containing protein [Promethearchaeota archaeon]